MIEFIRRALTAVALAAAAVITTSGPAAAAPPVVVDGFSVEHVPAGVGGQLSDFEYHWEGVTFRSKVWERGPDAEGAYAVDLTVKTLRGAPLTDGAALRDFLAGYHEQDPAGWREIEPGRAWLRPGAVFRFVEPGLATEVTLDEGRFDQVDLLTTAAGVRPVQPGCPAPPSRSGELAWAQ